MPGEMHFKNSKLFLNFQWDSRTGTQFWNFLLKRDASLQVRINKKVIEQFLLSILVAFSERVP